MRHPVLLHAVYRERGPHLAHVENDRKAVALTGSAYVHVHPLRHLPYFSKVVHLPKWSRERFSRELLANVAEPEVVPAVPVAHAHMRAVTASPVTTRPAAKSEHLNGLDARPRQ